jgi:hypothetical protein
MPTVFLVRSIHRRSERLLIRVVVYEFRAAAGVILDDVPDWERD